MSNIAPLEKGNPSKLAPFNPTSEDAIRTALRFAQLQPGEVALEIGCGDGRVLVAMAKSCPGARVIGIEYNEELATRAKARVAAGDVVNAEVICGDATLIQPTDVDIVFAYLTPTGLAAVEPYFRRLVQGPRHTRVISNAFTVPGWVDRGWLQETVRDKHGLALYRYQVPMPPLAVEETPLVVAATPAVDATGSTLIPPPICGVVPVAESTAP